MSTKPVQRVMFQGDTKNVVLVFFYDEDHANIRTFDVLDAIGPAKTLIDELGDPNRVPTWASKLLGAAIRGQEVSNHIFKIA